MQNKLIDAIFVVSVVGMVAYITTEMVVRAGRLAGRCRCNYHNVVEEGVDGVVMMLYKTRE